ncbi:MAG TPA: PQQ-dependent sugar dehydrogenase [Tepidisphaeraceae bacterium]|nr:PQQ-dependent sugar dehydrogenase [Tepidisphaeraceae bacterium]
MRYCVAPALLIALGFAAWAARLCNASDAASVPHSERVPWTTSRLTGSPDPPPPYRLVKAFPNLKFENLVDVAVLPGSGRLVALEQAGRAWSFPAGDPSVAKADPFIDLKKDVRGLEKVPDCKGVREAYAITFHPKFAQNRYCYVCYVLDVPVPGRSAERGSRISRFTVTKDDPPRLDPASEVVVFEWLGGGHNGCCLVFGPDGMLYISTGDGAGPSPPDPLNTGQAIDDVLSAILRIDVDRQDPGKQHAIPPDNPFAKTPGARPEVWAYGLRNPWRMSFDRATGDLWIGDVGWELWEMVFHGRPGGNYGWSVMEGPQPVRTDLKAGPTPIVPAAVALPHTESASITGGFVYRGKKLPGLVGKYVYGDWETRRLWASKLTPESKLAPYERIADSDERIISFAEDAEGELLVMGYEQGGIFRLEPNDVTQSLAGFPRKLSETGLFASVRERTPSPGVVPFEVNAPQWVDGAVAERLVAIPGTGSVGVNREGQKTWPKDSVLARTFLVRSGAETTNKRPVETQVLHFDGRRWNPYSYQWADDGTDAELVGAGGASHTYAAGTTWQFASRAQCATCHSSWAEFTLAYNEPQLDRGNQLQALRALGILAPPSQGNKPFRAMADPYHEAGDLEARARSYLHANCAHCHRFGGGGAATIDLRYEASPAEMKSLGVRPLLGTFDIPDARVIAPGDPARSVLLYRMARTGRGRMPHIGSARVDPAAVRLVEQWIRGLKAPADAPAPDSAAVKARAEEDAALQALKAANTPDAGKHVERLLSSTSGALALVLAMERDALPAETKQLVTQRTATAPDTVRDLFERFLPQDPSMRRLGSVVRAEEILPLRGDAGRGRQVFFGAGAGGAVLCAQCHRVGNDGQVFGPDLTQIALKYDRAKLLESVLEPSKAVEPQYVTHVLRTKKGQDYSGILVEKTAELVVLKDIQQKEVRVPAADVQRLVAQQQSAMPDGLLAGLTPQQAADLLAFLETLK